MTAYMVIERESANRENTTTAMLMLMQKSNPQHGIQSNNF